MGTFLVLLGMHSIEKENTRYKSVMDVMGLYQSEDLCEPAPTDIPQLFLH